MQWPVTQALEGWGEQEESFLAASPAPGSVEVPISRK